MFSGTVRENLDPQGLHEDRALWQALEQCHLREVIVTVGESGCWPEEQLRSKGWPSNSGGALVCLQGVWMESWAKGAGTCPWDRDSCCVWPGLFLQMPR